MLVRKPPSPSYGRSYQSGWQTSWKRSTCCQTTCWGLHQSGWSRAGVCLLTFLYDVVSRIADEMLSGNRQMFLNPLHRYMQSLQEILTFKDKNADDEKVTVEWVHPNMLHIYLILSVGFLAVFLISSFSFTGAVIKIRNRHNEVIPTMAQGVVEYKETYGTDPIVSQNVQYFLDRFYMSRISIRMLLNQHSKYILIITSKSIILYQAMNNRMVNKCDCSNFVCS